MVQLLGIGMTSSRVARVAVVGLGATGIKVVLALDSGIDGLALVALSARDPDKHCDFIGKLATKPPVLPIEQLSDIADIVIECAPSALLPTIVGPFVRKGKSAIVLSAGALLEHEELIDLAKQNGGQIIVPTGALIGLDAVAAAAEGNIHSVRMVTRKPVKGLAGAPYVVDNNIDIESITEPLKIFEGSAREAARGFPANLNVAVALSLAGIGADRTKLEICANPSRT
jgi:aspartate dehydrogenase